MTSQTDARIVVLELSKVHAIGGGGFGMLVFLQRWARDHNIRFLLFNPSKSVRDRLKRATSIAEFSFRRSRKIGLEQGHRHGRQSGLPGWCRLHVLAIFATKHLTIGAPNSFYR